MSINANKHKELPRDIQFDSEKGMDFLLNYSKAYVQICFYLLIKAATSETGCATHYSSFKGDGILHMQTPLNILFDIQVFLKLLHGLKIQLLLLLLLFFYKLHVIFVSFWQMW